MSKENFQKIRGGQKAGLEDQGWSLRRSRGGTPEKRGGPGEDGRWGWASGCTLRTNHWLGPRKTKLE